MKVPTLIKGSMLAISLALAGCGANQSSKAELARKQTIVGRVDKTETEWRAALTPQQYHVLREQGTERSFTGKLLHEKREGVFTCAGCDLELFPSETKFESGTGWPSFWQPINPDHVVVADDNSHGMVRDEVKCARCDGHLGHVFNDGPEPTRKRYCINSASLNFTPKDKTSPETKAK